MIKIPRRLHKNLVLVMHSTFSVCFQQPKPMKVGVIALEAAILITIPSARRRGRMRRSETDERNRFKRKGKSTW